MSATDEDVESKSKAEDRFFSYRSVYICVSADQIRDELVSNYEVSE
jgi:hypothetical protein